MKLVALIGVLLALAFGVFVGRDQSKRFELAFTTDMGSGAALDDLIGVIARSHAYGDRDNALAFTEALDRLTAAALEQQCGNISLTARDLLTSAGYEARRVAMLTGDALNQCDDGHTALEVRHPDYQRWLLVDFSTDRLYMQTVAEFVQERGVYRRLTDAPMATGYVYPCDSPLANGDVDAWYDRVAQIPLIEDSGVFYAPADHEMAARAVEYGYPVISGWQERFYSVSGR